MKNLKNKYALVIVALLIMVAGFCGCDNASNNKAEMSVRERAVDFSQRLLNIDTNGEDMDSIMIEMDQFEKSLSKADVELFNRYMDTLYVNVKEREAADLLESMHKDSLAMDLLGTE